jgi:serine acetyltransferase
MAPTQTYQKITSSSTFGTRTQPDTFIYFNQTPNVVTYSFVGSDKTYVINNTYTTLNLGGTSNNTTPVDQSVNYSKIQSIILGTNTTSIADNCLNMCISLKTIEIQGNLTTIGQYAFQNCTGLTSVTFNVNSLTTISNYAFNNCKSLSTTTFSIPTSVTTIGISAFEGCNSTSFTTIVIPTGVTSINASTFKNCTGFVSITIPSSVTTIGISAFEGCTSLTTVNFQSEGLISIGDRAFYGCTQLTSINIPNSVTTIGVSAFEGCTSLTTVNFQSGRLSSIGNLAFYGCTQLTSINIPNSVTIIGDYAFYFCRGLKSINIPNSVNSIGILAFYGCSGLTSITIPSPVTSIKFACFQYCIGITSVVFQSTNLTYIDSYAFANCRGIVSITIPDNVVTIYDYAFFNCSSLISLSIPNSLTFIGNSVFLNCTSLANINLGYVSTPQDFNVGVSVFSDISSSLTIQGATSRNVIPSSSTSSGMFSSLSTSNTTVSIVGIITIGDYAFYGCTEKISLTIPSSVTSIGTSAFQSCSKLSTINLGYTGTPTQPTITVNNNAFSDISSNIIIQGATSSNVIPSSSNSTGIFSSLSTSNTTVSIVGIITIGNYAFNGSTAIISVSIPGSVTSIGTSAFQGCNNRSFTTITLPNALTSIGTSAFQSCLKLSTIYLGYTSVTPTITVNNNAFKDISSNIIIQGATSSNVIPSSSTSSGMFSSLSTSNTTVSIVGIITIGDYAFNGSTAIISVIIPGSVTSIGTSAFQGCNNRSFTTITLPNALTSIGTSAFQSCLKLSTINLGYTTVTPTITVNNYAFKDISSNIVIQGATSSNVIPNSSSTLSGMFSSLSTSNTTVSILGIITIGDYAFYGCTEKISLTIQSTVTSIGTSAFQSCLKLSTINLGYTSVTPTITVNNYAFKDISSNIIIQGATSSNVIPSSSTSSGMFSS